MDKNFENEIVTTAWDFLQSHLNLERLAREQMPYDPKECTYSLGPLRQPLFACLTCQRNQKTQNGICYACSIKCHSTHELVELFCKRGRTCDCGTTRVSGPCFVRTPQWSKLIEDEELKYDPDIPDSCNSYGHNFSGKFCDCEQPYNPMVDSNMLQCTLGIACDEDWYHEECIMGVRPGVIVRTPRKLKLGTISDIKEDENNEDNDDGNQLESLGEPGLDAETDQINTSHAEIDNEATDEILPLPGFPDLNSFDTLICWKCIKTCKEEISQIIDVLKDTESLMHVKAKTLDERLTILRGEDKDDDLESSSKRIKKKWPFTLFLKEGYKDKLTEYLNNTKEETPLVKFLNRYPFLHLEEPTYEPPEDDDDDESSIYDLGLKEIQNLPADQAALGMMALNKLQAKLKEFLTPFAKDGGIVTEEAVNDFFKREMK